MIEKKDGKFIFKKPNIVSQLFIIFILKLKFLIKIAWSLLIIKFRFIYCGNIELKNLQGPDILKLLIAVDIQECLIEKLNFASKSNWYSWNCLSAQICGIFILMLFIKN